MWCSRRRFGRALGVLPALFLIAAAGCGFRPIYASGPEGEQGGSGPLPFGQIAAEEPKDRRGYLFVSAFESLIGQPESPRYWLRYTIAVTRRAREDRLDDRFARGVLFGRLTYSLHDGRDGPERTAGVVTAETAFSLGPNPLASATAEADSEARLMRLLAEGLVARLHLLALRAR